MIKHFHLLRKKPEEINSNPGLPKYYLNEHAVFNETNKKLNKLISIAERYHYHEEFHKHGSNLQNTWQILKEIIDKQTASICPRELC